MEGLLVTHARPHLDEIAAIGFYQDHWGLKPDPAHYGWASEAQIVFLTKGGEEVQDQDGEYLTDQIETTTPTLYIGVGRGRIDEHRLQEPSCAAMLAAQDLGIAEVPEVARLLRRIFVWETKGNKQPFDFAALVDAQWDRGEDEPEKVFAWAYLGITAEISRCLLHTEHKPPVRGLPEAYDWLLRFTQEKFGADAQPENIRELARLAGKCTSWAKGTPESPRAQLLDLADLTDGIRQIFGEAQAYQWFCDAVEAEYLRQQSYFRSADDFANAKIIEVAVRRRPLRVAFIESQDRMAHNYAFSQNISIAVVNDGGHVRIIPRRGLTLSMETVIALLRAMETRKKDLPLPRWHQLIASDPPSSAREWYFFTPRGSPAQWILNGSLSAPGIPPTNLVWPEEIECALVRGLDDRYWHERRQQDINVLLAP